MAMIIGGDVWIGHQRLSEHGMRHDQAIVAMQPDVDQQARPRMPPLSDARHAQSARTVTR